MYICKEDIELCRDEILYGLRIGLTITGAVFTVAAWCGAVVPVKWKPLWSKWFWNKNH